MNFNHVLVGDEQTATTHGGTKLAGWLGGRVGARHVVWLGVGGGPGGVHSALRSARFRLRRLVRSFRT